MPKAKGLESKEKTRSIFRSSEIIFSLVGTQRQTSHFVTIVCYSFFVYLLSFSFRIKQVGYVFADLFFTSRQLFIIFSNEKSKYRPHHVNSEFTVSIVFFIEAYSKNHDFVLQTCPRRRR